MPGNDNGPGAGAVTVNQSPAAGGMLVSPSLPTATDIAYVVVVVSPYGQPRRRPYLSLHHATAAVQRAEAKGQPARLVLCRLEPVAADLGGEWSA